MQTDILRIGLLRILVAILGFPWCISYSCGDVMSLLKDKQRVVQELVFSSEKPPIQEGGTNREPTKYYLLRWESPETFFVAEALSFEDLHKSEGKPPATLRCYSATKRRWWYLETLGEEFVAHTWDTSTPREECCNGVYKTIENMRRIDLDSVLSAGIPFACMAQITWEGDTYQFTNTSEQVFSAKGTILRDEAGLPKSVEHFFERPISVDGKMVTKVFRHRVEYEYGNDLTGVLPKDLPSEIRRFALREPNPPFFIERLRLHSFVLSKNALRSEQLDFEPIVSKFSAKALVAFVASNRTEYVLNGKKWTPVLSPDDPIITRAKPNPKTARFFFVVVMLLATMFFAVIYFAKTLRSKQKTNNKPQE